MLAKRWMARLPFDEVDVLVIDRIGKDISGTEWTRTWSAASSTIIGPSRGSAPRGTISIAIRGLTAETHGNAVGLGIAEFCRSQLLRRDGRGSHSAQCDHGGPCLGRHAAAGLRDRRRDARRRAWRGAAWPIVRRRGCCGLRTRWLWPRSRCSAAYLAEARQREDLEILTPTRDMPFDGEGGICRKSGIGLLKASWFDSGRDS